jgi:hypothetical protein
MKEPTQEIIKEFWEWCGFHLETDGRKGYHWEGGFRFHDWLTPAGETSESAIGKKGMLPPIDLNNLFKWAVPKVLRKYDIKIFSFYDDLNDKVFWFVHILSRETGEVEFAEIEGQEELKDVLFWAIYQVIKGETDS